MSHPHIAKVLDAGTTASGLPYFAMELVPGVPITDFCDARCLTLRERLELFVLVCRAIQHAHQKGVIHRDIKPSNILVAEHDGQPLPKVIDFGVAKAIGERLTEHTIHTALSQVIGTPLYMSPEQAEKNVVDVDTRSDVYSLGVLLYELLTGTVPFDKETLQIAGIDEMRRMIREDEPPRPSARLSTLSAQAISTISERRSLDVRRLRHSLQGELDWIVMKAVDKDRNRRYESANTLAADIERHLADQPVEARPAGWRLRASKWRRRNPVMSVIAVAVTVLMASLVAGSIWHNRQLTQALAVSDRLAAEGLDREADLRRELYVNDMRLAWGAATAGDLAEARRLVERHRPQAGYPDHAGFEWRYLNNLSRPPLRTMDGHRANILAADVSPDGRWIASGDNDGEVRIWELESGRLVKAWRYSENEVTTVRFSPEGTLLATGGQDRTTRLWNTQTWEEIAALEQHEMTVCSVAWSMDSKRLATTGRDQMVHIWDVPNRGFYLSADDDGPRVAGLGRAIDHDWLGHRGKR
jgi:eukaryotic-like serine/threonine-protein kinase